jgi:hypothetical protein
MNVSCPTTHYFLRRLLTMSRPAPHVAALAEYLCYLSMLHGGHLLRFNPSEIALSALILSAHSLEEEDQLSPDFLTQTLQSMSDCLRQHEPEVTKEDLRLRLNECMSDLLQLQKSAGSMVQKTIQMRFSHSKYFAAANADCLATAPQLQ